jgi:hypothetical protein
MALELEEGLTRLPYVENANDARVLGEGGEEMSVMWRCCDRQLASVRWIGKVKAAYLQSAAVVEARVRCVTDQMGWRCQGSSLFRQLVL